MLPSQSNVHLIYGNTGGGPDLTIWRVQIEKKKFRGGKTKKKIKNLGVKF
jgi:hypothetical protein